MSEAVQAMRPEEITFERLEEIIAEVSYPGYTITAHEGERWYVQGTFVEPDTMTGVPTKMFTRKWYISKHSVKSEIVQTLLKLVITSAEHHVREHFLYRGRRIFGPHYSVDALWALAGLNAASDVRREPRG
jgi:hypothetical protein